MSKQMWDERYGAADYAYGVEPNDFLRAEAGKIPHGPVLCLAEGEGRNAVFLAERGHTVTAVDFSVEGLRKAERLARDRGVRLDLVEADLSTFDLGVERWSGVVSIFAHTPPELRHRLHAAVARALRPGGALVLEAYRPEQLALATGGPRDAAWMPRLSELKGELAALDLVIAREVEREIHEGKFHDGPSATVQIVGIRRA